MTATVINMHTRRNVTDAGADALLAARYAMTAKRIVDLCATNGMDPVVLAGTIVAEHELRTLPTLPAPELVVPTAVPAAERPGVIDRFRGAKYVDGRDVAEIAKLLRADIKAARKDGSLALPANAKVSVRIDRYSMGCSIQVNVSGLTPDQRWANYAAGPYASPAYGGRTDLVQVTYTQLEEMVNAYQRNNSDSQTDYYDVNFSGSVTFSD